MTDTIYYYLLYTWIAIGIVSFPFLLKKTAPYGRHTTDGWGPMIPNQIGWMIMEGFAPLFISFWFWKGDLVKTNASYFFYGLYVLHYVYRSYIFPFRTKTASKKIPLVITGSAIFFNLSNTFIIGYFLGSIGGNYSDSYFTSPRFFAGLLVFITGVYINIKSDNMLIALRKPGETGYKIPSGFLFDKISCPNLFGEMVEWFGFALMMGALPAWSFTLWTMVNLIPRALDHHKWYLKKFAEYPKNRKAVIPWVL
jgi:hypothetical protein